MKRVDVVDRFARRLVAPALVGAVLGVAAGALWLDVQRGWQVCDGCWTGLVLWLAIPPAAVLLGGLALMAVRVPRGWLIAVLAVPVALVVVYLYEGTIVGTFAPPVWATSGLAAAGYLLAAVVVGTSLSWVARSIVGLIVVAMLPVGSYLDHATLRQDRLAKLTALRIPLLVPVLPGYRPDTADADVPHDILMASIVSRTYRGPAYLSYDDSITVVVRPQSDGASLPPDCSEGGTTCVTVGAGQWTTSGAGPLRYFVLRDGVDVALGGGDDVPQTDLRQAAQSLRRMSANEIWSATAG
jgi:hypothetical protein